MSLGNASTSKTNCCVVGCTNYYSKTCGKNVSFYSFPSEKKWPGRSNKWVDAVNRRGKDGKLWKPKNHSRICSQHFVGGKKVDDSRHPSFLPSIFPPIYKKRPINEQQCQDRFNRRQRRNTSLDVATGETTLATFPQDVEDSKQDISTQTESILGSEVQNGEPSLEYWFCSSNSCNVSCQARISVKSQPPKVKPAVYSIKTYKSTGTGGEGIDKNIFTGYLSILNDQQLKSLCGVSIKIFLFLLTYLTPKRGKASDEDRLMIFLMKLKLGISFCAISVLFGISRHTVSRIFHSLLSELTEKCSQIIFWPTREDIRTRMPDVFNDYPNLRSIIDCTEFRCERPSRVDEQVWNYSNYKGNYTKKFLISITPQGFISFLSDGFGGRSTDAFITANSGFLDLLEKGDLVMADKGFPQIEFDLRKKSVSLVMPPFAYNPQFTEAECVTTYEIAKVRIHVERCISRIRIFHILDKLLHFSDPHVNSIVQMCAILVNLQPPILKFSDFDADDDNDDCDNDT